MSDYRMMALTEEEAEGLREMIADHKVMKEEREKEKKHGGWTKERIMGVQDTVKRQNLIREHWELFSK